MDERPVTIEELERWVEFGARWRALAFEPGRAVVELCQCTGELVERRVAVDPEVIAYVRAHADETD
ncbi:MAG TPA: hypothetical protein VFN65_04800 [Solirubrobacteraceae bacterium]|nr:hypothetical protein [Solirubrobacteraceae bacterium]